jgi:hypothetical protein
LDFGFASRDVVFMARSIFSTLRDGSIFTSGRFGDVLSQFLLKESSSYIATIDASFSFGDYTSGLIFRDGTFLGYTNITCAFSFDLFKQTIEVLSSVSNTVLGMAMFDVLSSARFRNRILGNTTFV